ncbi:hypothetical protein KFK09_026334 [Dendrobium nobile]|uniref:Uncharacterized protein n=1 Tax=Dendrobium nobile TaxID=94219 RepID=A0A8T3A7M9_DENNO|nr:hypothetical protein KFK09_026334 [Dendrobium nobile]
MLPRRERFVRVDRSSERHLRQVSETELRVRTSMIREKVCRRTASGRSSRSVNRSVDAVPPPSAMDELLLKEEKFGYGCVCLERERERKRERRS